MQKSPRAPAPPESDTAIMRLLSILMITTIGIALCAGIFLPAQDVDRMINRVIASAIGGAR